MTSTTELHTRTEFDHSHAVSVFLSEKGYRTHSGSFVHSSITLLFKRIILPDKLVDTVLYSCYLLLGKLLEMREVETEVLVTDK